MMQRDQNVEFHGLYERSLKLRFLIGRELAVWLTAHTRIEEDESPASLVVNACELNTVTAEIACDPSR